MTWTIDASGNELLVRDSNGKIVSKPHDLKTAALTCELGNQQQDQNMLKKSCKTCEGRGVIMGPEETGGHPMTVCPACDKELLPPKTALIGKHGKNLNEGDCVSCNVGNPMSANKEDRSPHDIYADQSIKGCEDCGVADISPNVEAFEISGKTVCDECAEKIFEDNSQFGVGA